MKEYICYFEEKNGYIASESVKFGGELIRCKDCKHYDSEHEVCCVYVSFRLAKDANDYCSDAERKE